MTKEDEEFTLDITKISNFFNKIKWNKYSILLLLLIPMFLSFYFRAYSVNLPITDEWAEQSIRNQVRNQISRAVVQQYPNLPQQNRDQIINQQYDEWIKTNQAFFQTQVKEVSKQLKSNFQDDNGDTYLLAIDPWFYFRHIRTKIETGSFADKITEDGKEWSMYMLAPLGAQINIALHEHFGYLWHRLVTFLNPNASLLKTFFYVPIIISILTVIPAFFIARKISGNFGGLIASIMVGIHSMFINRTAGGFSDTDAYNILFPLLISWMVLEALSSKDFKKTTIYSSIGGILIGMYSFSWIGWWHIFYVVICSIMVYIGYVVLSQREKVVSDLKSNKYTYIKNTLAVFMIFILVSSISIGFVKGWDEITGLPKRTLKIINLKQASKGTSIWPNVYTTVAELGDINLSGIITNLAPYRTRAGKTLSGFYFFIVLMGMIFSIIDFKKIRLIEFILIGLSAIWFFFVISRQNLGLILFLILISLPIAMTIILSMIRRYKVDIKYAIFLIIWFCVTIYGATRGVRFVLLIVPAFGLAFGIALGKMADFIIKVFTKELKIPLTLSQLAVFAFLAILLIKPIQAADATARREVPSMNDGWYISLDKINREAAPDAIINSWWDFGHWFKAIGNRSVTFDGASQNTPQAHWIGKTLLTSDEKQAISILRMLDCGGLNAFKEIDEEYEDALKTVNKLYEVISKDEEDAMEFLEEEFSKEKSDKILKETHCNPPENYFITSEDMVGKSGVWAHFGSWRFQRAKIYTYFNTLNPDEFNDQLSEEFGYTEEEAQKIYFEIQSLTTDRAVNDWIAPWPSYGGSTGCSKNEQMLSCRINVNNNQALPVTINLTSMDAYVDAQGTIVYPNSFGFYDKDDNYIIKEYEGDLIGTSISLLNESNSYSIIMSAPDLVGSMFTRLFYHNGRGLEHFDKFSDIRDITGARIIVWKVDWDGK